MKKLSILLLFSLGSCLSQKKNESSPQIDYSITYIKPMSFGGAWTRVIRLSGKSIEGKAIDRQRFASQTWEELGISNREGAFYDQNIGGKLRYRIAGIVETPWMDEKADIFFTSAPASRSLINGGRCIFNKDILFVADAQLTLECDEILIFGKIAAFSTQATPGTQGLNAANLNFKARLIEVRGEISLVGQKGGRGRDGRFRGENGQNGGAGGTLHLQASEQLLIRAPIHVDGGAGGEGGVDQIGNPNQAPSGERGATGTVTKSSPYINE